MITGFLTFSITMAVMAWVVGRAKAKSSSIKTLNNGDRVLKNHTVFALLGYFIGLIFLFFLGLGFYFGWESNPDDTWVSYIFPVVIMLLLLYGFVYITFYYYNHRVVYNATSITSYDAYSSHNFLYIKNVVMIVVKTIQ